MREGLMDDTGFHGFDDSEEFFEKYCSICKNLPFERDSNGDLWVLDCNRHCSLSDPRYFEEVDD